MTSCPLCGAAAEPSFRGPHVDVHRCEDAACGHLFAAGVDPRHGVMHARSPDLPPFEERNRRLIAFWERRGFVWDGARILDVGAGTGHLARSLRARLTQAHLTCIEESGALAGRLRNEGFDVLAGLDALPDGAAFDAILLIEVIEHVPDPVSFLRRLGAHLAPGARVFLTTPCGELRTGGRPANAYDTPEHVHFFTEGSLQRAVRAAGFAPFRCERVDALYPRPVRVLSASGIRRLVRRAALPLLERVQGPRHLTGFVERPSGRFLL